jgi:hypothetical protein
MPFHDLPELRQLGRFVDECIDPAADSFRLDFSRAIPRQHDDERAGVAPAAEPNQFQPLGTGPVTEGEIGEDDIVCGALQKRFGLFELSRRVDFVSFALEKARQSEDDRFFVVNDEKFDRHRRTGSNRGATVATQLEAFGISELQGKEGRRSCAASENRKR